MKLNIPNAAAIGISGFFLIGVAGSILKVPSDRTTGTPVVIQVPEPKLKYNWTSDVCMSDTPECMQWHLLAARCEDALNAVPRGVLKIPQQCDEVEDYREQVSGVKDEFDPGYLDF